MFAKKIREKFSEAMKAVSPIMGLVLLLSLTVAPMPAGTLLSFLMGSLMLIVGMMLFSLGAEVSMEPMGELVGASLTRTKNLKLVLGFGFLLGFIITVSEPDLQVLANQVQAIPNLVLILFVGIGVGLFLVLALVRMLFSIRLRTLLWISYTLVFLLALFAPDSFLAVAFDSGGVTTGPMTVPFIMSFGIGIAAIRNDRHAADDSFGLVALCSVGPILAVLLLSMIFRPDGSAYQETVIPVIDTSTELTALFTEAIPSYIGEIALAILPIVLFFLIFDLVTLRLDRKMLGRILLGLLYTYVGLTMFLTGANVGFMPAGSYLGSTLAGLDYNWMIIPLGMLIGFFIVRAEPAVYVLMRQVEELTDGAITGKSLQNSLCIGVSASIGLSMLRVLTGLPVMWLLVPGYIIALLMSFVAPKMFMSIAFDSGGVASGPMTATFLLPFSCGACLALGGNVVTDAFGVVSMVAMTPLITIQILGLIYKFKERRRKFAPAEEDLFAGIPDNAIIDL